MAELSVKLESQRKEPSHACENPQIGAQKVSNVCSRAPVCGDCNRKASHDTEWHNSMPKLDGKKFHFGLEFA